MPLLKLGSIYRLDSEAETFTLCCDFCEKDAVAEITLSEGECWTVCDSHILSTIEEKATTDNPVHSIEEIN